jgi:hypothetical protein
MRPRAVNHQQLLALVCLALITAAVPGHAQQANLLNPEQAFSLDEIVWR